MISPSVFFTFFPFFPAILSIYIKNKLHFSEDSATIIYHMFSGLLKNDIFVIMSFPKKVSNFFSYIRFLLLHSHLRRHAGGPASRKIQVNILNCFFLFQGNQCHFFSVFFSLGPSFGSPSSTSSATFSRPSQPCPPWVSHLCKIFLKKPNHKDPYYYILLYYIKIFFSEFSLIGLALIAIGTGGIKPCVSAFGGDQVNLNLKILYSRDIQ